MILSLGAVGFVRGAFDALAPMPVERGALSLNVVGRRQTQLQRRRFQYGQDLLSDQPIQHAAGQRLASRLTVCRRVIHADITRAIQVGGDARLRMLVLHQHATAAAAAAQQALEQSCALAHRAAGIAAGLILDQLTLVRLVLPPRDVSRATILQQHRAVLGRRDRPARARSAGDLLARVGWPAAPAIRPGVKRMMQQVPQRLTIGPAPLQLAAIRSHVRSDRHLNPLSNHVTQHRIDRAQFVKLLEDQTHHRLHLLVGVERQSAVRSAHIAQRRMIEQLPALGLVQPALLHALTQKVQLRFTERTLESQQQTIVVLARIVQAVLVGQQRAEQRTDLQQLMPVLA